MMHADLIEVTGELVSLAVKDLLRAQPECVDAYFRVSLDNDGMVHLGVVWYKQDQNWVFPSA